MMALSRTCDLRDFADCLTVASWQQQLAAHAWERWVGEAHLLTRTPSYCVNWSGCPFDAPGPTAIYQLRHQPEPRVPKQVPAVFGLCVLDHVDAPVRFLTESVARLRRGGLVCLTYAFWDAEGPDTAAGNNGRRRIYDAKSQTKLIAEARKLGLVPYGGLDWAYHGNTLDDHTLASLVLIRREP
jgi:hypothetical protein